MTPTLWYARACTLAAVTLVGTAIYTGCRAWWIPAAVLTYSAAFLIAYTGRLRDDYRRQRADAVHAERAARPHAPVPPPPPCCSVWRYSGKVHGPDCTRPPAARAGYKGVLLTDREWNAFRQITDHYDDRTAA